MEPGNMGRLWGWSPHVLCPWHTSWGNALEGGRYALKWRGDMGTFILYSPTTSLQVPSLSLLGQSSSGESRARNTWPSSLLACSSPCFPRAPPPHVRGAYLDLIKRSAWFRLLSEANCASFISSILAINESPYTQMAVCFSSKWHVCGCPLFSWHTFVSALSPFPYKCPGQGSSFNVLSVFTALMLITV